MATNYVAGFTRAGVFDKHDKPAFFTLVFFTFFLCQKFTFPKTLKKTITFVKYKIIQKTPMPFQP